MQALVDILLLIKTLMRQKILSSPLPLTMKLTALWDNHSDCQSSMVLSYVSCVCTYVWAAVKGSAREQAIRGALAGGREREGELATTSLEFIMNIYIKKVDADCLLAEMTLVMTSLLLARVFQCLFTFALIGRNLTAQSTRSQRGNGGGIQILGYQRIKSLTPLVWIVPSLEKPLVSLFSFFFS